MKHWQFFLVVSLCLLVEPPGIMESSLPSIATITVSGTITGPGGGAVPNVSLTIAWNNGAVTATTNSVGFYTVAGVSAGSFLNFFIRPPVSARLAMINYRVDLVTTDLTKDFSLKAGYLLSGTIATPDGSPTSGSTWIEVSPYTLTIPPNEWLGFWVDFSVGTIERVLQPDIYALDVMAAESWYPQRLAVDLRYADALGIRIILSRQWPNPYNYDPPNVSRITIGSPDDLCEVPIAGASGAVLPLSRVLLVNLNSMHQANAIAEADGSFNSRIFAPPGSALLFKHGLHDWRWGNVQTGVSEQYTAIPGSIIHVPHANPNCADCLPFASAGAISCFVDNNPSSRNHVGSAWTMTGTMRPASIGGAVSEQQPAANASPDGSHTFAPGDSFIVTSTLQIISPAIAASTSPTDMTVSGRLGLLMIFDAQGHPLPMQNHFMSTLLTPTGFPIQRSERPIRWLASCFAANPRHAGDHIVQYDVSVTATLPSDLPFGIYRPIIQWEFTGVPTSSQWLAAFVNSFTYDTNQAALPPIHIGAVAPPRLIWRLLMDDLFQGLHGTGAREDIGIFELGSQIVSQGAAFVIPPVDLLTNQPITYRLEPFLPMVSYGDRNMPSPPLLPFDLPGGQLSVHVRRPDGIVLDLGSESLAQSFNRTKSTRGGRDLNGGTVNINDVYSLKASSNRFRLTFSQYGHYVITMTGTINDLWGNTYSGGGTYDLWVAHPLDIDPGVLPGTPFQVGDVFNPALQTHPGVPAFVQIILTLYPNSDPARSIVQTVRGWANRYGYFSPNAPPLRLTQAGEYRVDLTATHTEADSTTSMGSMTWSSVVETPNSPLVAHGRRGLDILEPPFPRNIPGNWFISCRDLSLRPGDIPHMFNPYFNGDILWSRMTDAQGECPPGIRTGGDSLIMGASVQDTVGSIEAAIRTRANRKPPELSGPGSLSERFSAGEIPLFISTRSGYPAQMKPGDIDQIAYSYRYSQRPGERVRELVGEDALGSSYWRLDTLYDDQPGVGISGDLPNDFKFQYVGTAYRDLDIANNQYGIHGSFWVFMPTSDSKGTRAMPPFAGPGNGGWTTEGGPLLRLKGKDIHVFIQPTGTSPGSILNVGDIFRFAGHIAPTLNSKLDITITSPGGIQHFVRGQADKIGYFYDPAQDFAVNEAGIWSTDVRVWHDGTCSGGQTQTPYPSGDMLGSENGRFWFYVTPKGAPRLNVAKPASGFLKGSIIPITISGAIPGGVTDTTVDYVITMPGYILKHGQAVIGGGTYTFVFDPVALSADFPNLDLYGRDFYLGPGLSDTFKISFLLRGRDSGGKLVHVANTITIQGDLVVVGTANEAAPFKIYLPLIYR